MPAASAKRWSAKPRSPTITIASPGVCIPGERRRDHARRRLHRPELLGDQHEVEAPAASPSAARRSGTPR
jgi:hypothetical protein